MNGKWIVYWINFLFFSLLVYCEPHYMNSIAELKSDKCKINQTTFISDFILLKRSKPSLSIVNPLDVLRQRLMLEIARRHMRENTKQVYLIHA